MAGEHNNIFRPYEHHAIHHEDPLSRAAVLLMRLVPLAYQCFLDLATLGPEETPVRVSVADLPKGEFSVQRAPLKDDKARNLLSVFLTPGAEAPKGRIPVDVITARNAIHDGFIRHKQELIVVIEAKRYDQPNYEQARSPGRMDIEQPGSVRFVSWTALVERWSELSDNGFLSHAESELLEDFLDLLNDNEQINPFSRLSRCRGRDLPVALRLQNLLSDTFERPAHPRWESWESGGEIPGILGSADRLLLTRSAHEPFVRLGVWAGLTQQQKNIFYSDPGRLEQLAAAVSEQRDSHWTVHVEWMLELKPPRFENPTQTLAKTEVDPRSRLLSTQRLAHKLNRRVQEPDLASYLEDFIAAGLTSEKKVGPALLELETSGYSEWRLVAPAYVYCAWPLDQATELDQPDNPVGNPFEVEIKAAATWLLRIVGADLP